jgi:hypothetical protein
MLPSTDLDRLCWWCVVMITVMLLTLCHTALLLLLLLLTVKHSRNELYEDHDALRNGPGVFNT